MTNEDPNGTIDVMDCHSDLPLCLLKERDDGVRDSLRTYWLPRLERGGVRVIVCAISTPPVFVSDGALRHGLRAADALFQEINDNRQRIEFADNVADIGRIRREGKIAALLALEGAEPIGQDLSVLRLFHRLGVRMVSLTWSRPTAFADGIWENDSERGLSQLGRRAVREMNALGIVIDISHASDRAATQVIEESQQPVIASHSNARARQMHPRNLPDELIHGLAARGGVIAVNAVPGFISDHDPTVDKLVDHIEHIVGLVGVDHVAVGADFVHRLRELRAFQLVADENPALFARSRSANVDVRLQGLAGPEEFPSLASALLRRGIGVADVRKIFYDNALRLLTQVLAGASATTTAS